MFFKHKKFWWILGGVVVLFWINWKWGTKSKVTGLSIVADPSTVEIR